MAGQTKLMLPSGGSVSISASDSTQNTTVTLPGGDVTLATTSQVMGRNRIINGDMRIDQRNAGASVTNNATVTQYTLDRWAIPSSVSGKFSAQQSSDAPAGFANSLLITSLSSYSVLAADYFEVSQRIEGLNCSDLAFGTASAKTVTLSFWVKSSLTGTFGGVLQNSAGNRSYPFTYSISSVSTWEQKTVSVAGDTTGTWLTTSGVGLRVIIGLGVGSTYSGTAGAWAATDYESATGATSVVGTNGATFYITGVQLEKATTATPFEFRPYGQELALCQRYYEVGSAYLAAYTSLAANYPTGMLTGTNFQATKRAAPTVAVSTTASSSIYTNSGSTANITTASFSQGGLVQTQSNFGSITITWTAASEL